MEIWQIARYVLLLAFEIPVFAVRANAVQRKTAIKLKAKQNVSVSVPNAWLTLRVQYNYNQMVVRA